MKTSCCFLFAAMYCCVCAGAAEWKAEKIADIDGLDGPECMLPDPERDVVYVSNIETSTGEYWADDGSGFVSVMTPKGKIKERRWTDTSQETVLNAPKGMCILKGYLYFSDNGHLRRCKIAPKGNQTMREPDDALKRQPRSDLFEEVMDHYGNHVFMPALWQEKTIVA